MFHLHIHHMSASFAYSEPWEPSHDIFGPVYTSLGILRKHFTQPNTYDHSTTTCTVKRILSRSYEANTRFHGSTCIVMSVTETCTRFGCLVLVDMFSLSTLWAIVSRVSIVYGCVVFQHLRFSKSFLIGYYPDNVSMHVPTRFMLFPSILTCVLF